MLQKIKHLFQEEMYVLLFATGIALLWANVFSASYIAFASSTKFFINEILFATFFGIVVKEIREARLPGGSLYHLVAAVNTIAATIGGVVMPVLLFVGLAKFVGAPAAVFSGWAVVCATDIAFSKAVAAKYYPNGTTAITALLLLAILDDLIGLGIVATLTPEPPKLQWLWLVVLAVAIGKCFAYKKVYSQWPYVLICGSLSWIGLHEAHLHPALALVPIMFVMPIGDHDQGLFEDHENDPKNTVEQFGIFWGKYMRGIVFMFALVNAGVVISGESFGMVTFLVAASLVFGKPFGVWSFGMIARYVGFQLPNGMQPRDLWIIGCASGIGFTVAIFVATVAYPDTSLYQAQAKLGALLSLFAVCTTALSAKLLGIKK